MTAMSAMKVLSGRVGEGGFPRIISDIRTAWDTTIWDTTIRNRPTHNSIRKMPIPDRPTRPVQIRVVRTSTARTARMRAGLHRVLLTSCRHSPQRRQRIRALRTKSLWFLRMAATRSKSATIC